MLAVRAETTDDVVTVELTVVHCAASMAFGYTVDGGNGTPQVMACSRHDACTQSHYALRSSMLATQYPAAIPVTVSSAALQM